MPILSVITSTYLIYFVSLLIGFSRYSITLSFLAFCPWLFYYLFKEFNLKKLITGIQKNFTQLILGLIVFSAFFLALFPGIFTRHGDYIVMSSVNWQDTAMHTGIIESIAQGNFPPESPYYSGTPLNYYYFTDFHSAILVNLFGRFFPRVLVYTNPLFAASFSMALYALAYEIGRRKKAAVASSLAGVFFGNLMFIGFFQDIFNLRINLFDLLANKSYSMEYEKVFQMSSMGDYFLQNRPMMVGLPAMALVILFLIRGFEKRRLGEILLAGVFTGALIKFQYFGIVIGFIAFGFAFLTFFTLKRAKFLFKAFFTFFLPIVLISLPFVASTTVNGRSIVSVIKDNFSLGPWEREKDISWHLRFILGNFQLPFLLTIASILNIKKLKKPTVFLFLMAVSLFGIPYLMRFTVYKGDMFKFFYFMVIPMSVLAPLILTKVFRNQKVLFGIVIAFLFITSFSSVLTLANSALNKNMAYNQSDLEAGLWMRSNTPQKSVFIAMPTVHTPISQIGGRLRVLSYINWPYSHGYNSGDDNVFKRLADIEKTYRQKDVEVVKEVIKGYNADYIFYGSEERRKFPSAENFLDSLDLLKIVYNNEGIKIYEIK